MTSIGHMTYTGSCRVAGKDIICTNMSASLDQKLLFFDHILGVQDEFGNSGKTKKASGSGGGLLNTQKKVYRYSPAIARASISAPITEDSTAFQIILNKAIHGDDLDVEMTFWKNGAYAKVGKAKVTSFSIDVKAGDIARFSAELVGAEYDFLSVADAHEMPCVKLLTWDACHVDADPVATGESLSSFTLSISNPAVPIYTSQWTKDTASNGMMPQKIRLGMQEVTGTIGVYGAVAVNVPSLGTVKFDLGGAGQTVKAAFVQPKDDASGGVYIRTITFNGVNDGSVWTG